MDTPPSCWCISEMQQIDATQYPAVVWIRTSINAQFTLFRPGKCCDSIQSDAKVRTKTSTYEAFSAAKIVSSNSMHYIFSEGVQGSRAVSMSRTSQSAKAIREIKKDIGARHFLACSRCQWQCSCPGCRLQKSFDDPGHTAKRKPAS